jgi:hypothetical protein
VSDTPRAPWRHTSPGRGEVDFAAFAGALADVGYAEATVDELVDEEDPAPRLADDLAALAAHGWSVDGRWWPPTTDGRSRRRSTCWSPARARPAS